MKRTFWQRREGSSEQLSKRSFGERFKDLIDRADFSFHTVINKGAEKIERTVGISREGTVGVVMCVGTAAAVLTKSNQTSAMKVLVIGAFCSIMKVMNIAAMRNFMPIRDLGDFALRIERKVFLPVAVMIVAVGYATGWYWKLGAAVMMVALSISDYLSTSRDGSKGGFWENEPPRKQ